MSTVPIFDVRLSHVDDSTVHFDMPGVFAKDAIEATEKALGHAANFIQPAAFKAQVLRSSTVTTLEPINGESNATQA